MISSTGTRWTLRETDANIPLMADTLQISPIMARVMANRGIRTKKTALSFLKTSIDHLHPFLDMKNAQTAISRTARAIKLGQKITIYGDYDADGITSTAILVKLLRRLGAIVSYYIPHRITEGYGMNKTAVQKLAEGGTKLIIAVDNGISAIDEVDLANSLGIETIIIDHHEPGDTLPLALAIIDPKQHDCPYPFKELCAGGLSYKFAAALCEYLDTPFLEKEEFLVLAAIATICDIVKLTDENRILANCGVIVLNANKLINPGLGSLITVRGYLEKTVDTFTVGFVIGPCINAAGRLSIADIAIELLLADAEDIAQRMELTNKLIELNDERRQLTADCVERLLTDFNAQGHMDKVIVITDTETHESIAGIVAGRIREATGHPTIVLTQGEYAMKGSGRSSPCYNLFDALSAHKHLFLRFGGHSMAAGLTLPNENIPILREALNRDCTLTDEDFLPVLEIDAELDFDEITLNLADELIKLAPFGSGNHEPLFVSRGLFAESVRIIDEKSTLIFSFSNGTKRTMKGLAFGLNEKYAKAIVEAGVDKNGGFRLDVVYAVEVNVYNGAVSVQMRVRDFKIE